MKTRKQIKGRITISWRWIRVAAAGAFWCSLPCLAQTPKHVLVVSVADSYVHSCIATANQVFAQIAQASGDFTIEFAQTDQNLRNKMSMSALSNYDGVVFQNTSGDLPLPNRDGFLTWIASGKGFMAVHNATECLPVFGTLPSYPAYADLIGAEYASNAGQMQVQVFSRDAQNAATRPLPSSFLEYDEIYLFTNFQSPVIHELFGMKQHPTTGAPGDYPLAWCRSYGDGRVLATLLGHREDVWESTLFQQHLSGGFDGCSVDRAMSPGSLLAARLSGRAIRSSFRRSGD